MTSRRVEPCAGGRYNHRWHWGLYTYVNDDVGKPVWARYCIRCFHWRVDVLA